MSDTYRVIISKRADADLEAIHGSISRSSPDGAVTVVGDVLKSLELLAVLPKRNRVVTTPPTNPPVRSLPVPPYMVYFEVYEDRRVVYVLRIRHGARKPLKRFR